MGAGEDQEGRGSLGWEVQLEKEADVGNTTGGTVSIPEDQLRGSVQGKPRPQWTPNPWPSAGPHQGCDLGPRWQKNLQRSQCVMWSLALCMQGWFSGTVNLEDKMRWSPGGALEVKGGPGEMEGEPRLWLNCCVSLESCSTSWSLILCTRQLQTSFIILLSAQDIQHTVGAT